MSIERCPVCNGSGRITEPAPAYSSSAVGATRTCHGCLGKGWIGLDEALIRADERKVALTNLLESIEARMAEVREIIKYTNPDSASSFGGQLIAYAIVVQAIRKAGGL